MEGWASGHEKYDELLKEMQKDILIYEKTSFSVSNGLPQQMVFNNHPWSDATYGLSSGMPPTSF